MMQAFYSPLVLLIIVGIVAKGTQGQAYGRATFNIRGITGHITFTPAQNGMMITTNISGTNAHHHWHVHIQPVDSSLPPAMRCSNDIIGVRFDPFGAVPSLGSKYLTYCNPNNQTACEVGDLSGKLGHLSSGVQTYMETTGELKLFGTNGIIGRSIKIHGSEDVCATILSSTEEQASATVTILQASFTYPVGGTVYMRQVTGERAVIFGKLYWVNASSTTMNHRWSIRINQPSQYYREGNCDGIGDQYNPLNINSSSASYSNCGPSNLDACVVGDLSGKHGNINISSQPAPYSNYSFLFQDSRLNLTGDNSVSGRSLVIYSTQGNAVLACAPLVQVEILSVSAGSQFTASQTSHFSPTLITTTYSPSGLRVFSSAIAPNSLCKEAFTAGRSRVYNPHSAPPLDGSSGTPDRYPVGNFSIKYRSFSQSGVNKVTELPIHGYETISGHSLGYMSRESGSTTHACFSLWPQYPPRSNVKMAKATFNTTVTGAIYFIQRSFGNGVFGSTHIIVDIWYTNSRMATTSGHDWHIYERPPVPGQVCTGNIGDHFNPFNADSDNYATECTPFAPLRCESGDLNGKHMTLDISPASPNRPTYTYTDNNLHLWGPAKYSIIGRSVGLHLPASQGGALFDCSSIREVVFSSRDIIVSLPYNASFDRTDFAAKLTNPVSDASPSDVLMVKQEMTTDSNGKTGCVSATLRTFGESSNEADSTLSGIESSFDTDSECSTTPSPSAMGLLFPSFVLLLFSFMLATAAI